MFEPKTNTYSNNSFVGYHLDLTVHNTLRLLSVHKEVYVATLLKDTLLEHLKTQPTLEELITILAKKAHKEWNKLCIKMDKKNGWRTGKQLTAKWEKFVERSRKSLSLRRIPNDLIDIIITELEELEINR